MRFFFIFLLIIISYSFANKKPSRSIEGSFFVELSGKSLLVYYSNKYLATYNFSDTLYKPFFWPVKTLNGIEITRGYPLRPMIWEPVDHPHQTGIWFNFGNVNGIDFWNNSDAIPKENKHLYGKIEVDSFQIVKNNSQVVRFFTVSRWRNNEGEILLYEKTNFILDEAKSIWSITRITTLTANTAITLNDNKEGLFAIRLAREFQFDNNKAEFLIDSTGNISKTRLIHDEGKSGMYSGSNGTSGVETWGTSNKWVEITAIKEQDSISILIFDHPKNFSFPAYWHTRDYGLFAVNNLGRKSYQPDLPGLQKELQKGDSITFRHKILFKNSGSFSKVEIDSLEKTFYTE